MLKLYDSLERQEKEFKPARKKASMYYCGPTVYWTQHIGNMRAFFVMDTLRRVIEFNGQKLFFAKRRSVYVTSFKA